MKNLTTTERLKPLDRLQGLESTHLLINEIYASIQGESTHAGRPCVFVRTSVCNQRCKYCDTAYAFTGGEAMHIDEVVRQALSHGIELVEITGGEPLLQPLLPSLCTRLLEAGCEVLLETGGSHDTSAIPAGVHTILDIKTPGSGEAHRNLWENIALLTPHDQVKFVLCGREDYDWARRVLAEHDLANRCDVLFSPSKDQLGARELADWIVADRLPVRFQVQLHKILWDDGPGR